MDEQTKCPVCEYELGFLPWVGESPSDEICPRCFIQFGYDDSAGGDTQQRLKIYEIWKTAWTDAGSQEKWKPSEAEIEEIHLRTIQND